MAKVAGIGDSGNPYVQLDTLKEEPAWQEIWHVVRAILPEKVQEIEAAFFEGQTQEEVPPSPSHTMPSAVGLCLKHPRLRHGVALLVQEQGHSVSFIDEPTANEADLLGVVTHIPFSPALAAQWDEQDVPLLSLPSWPTGHTPGAGCSINIHCLQSWITQLLTSAPQTP